MFLEVVFQLLWSRIVVWLPEVCDHLELDVAFLIHYAVKKLVYLTLFYPLSIGCERNNKVNVFRLLVDHRYAV
jgi:hypothetical protein